MKNIYVGNLPYTLDDQELKALFESYGEVSRATIVTDRETGRPRGFGFVEMPSVEDGTKAIESLNGSDFGGRSLTVNEARPRQPRQQSSGGYR